MATQTLTHKLRKGDYTSQTDEEGNEFVPAKTYKSARATKIRAEFDSGTRNLKPSAAVNGTGTFESL
jgi:hypothetical protein